MNVVRWEDLSAASVYFSYGLVPSPNRGLELRRIRAVFILLCPILNALLVLFLVAPHFPQRPSCPGSRGEPLPLGAGTHQGEEVSQLWVVRVVCRIHVLQLFSPPRDVLDLTDMDSEPPRGPCPTFEPRNLLSLFEDSLDPA